MKSSHVKYLKIIKIAGHQDKIKKHYKLLFERPINIRCNEEVKILIIDQIESGGRLLLPLQINSLIIRNNKNKDLITTKMIRDDMHKQIVNLCLVEKLKLGSIEELNCSLRKSIIKLLPPKIYV